MVVGHSSSGGVAICYALPVSSREMVVLVYTAIFEKNMRNSTVNYLIPDWLTAVT